MQITYTENCGCLRLPHTVAMPGSDVQALATIISELLDQIDVVDNDAEVTAKESELYWKAFQSATSRKTRLDSSRATVQKWRVRGNHHFRPNHGATQVRTQCFQCVCQGQPATSFAQGDMIQIRMRAVID